MGISQPLPDDVASTPLPELAALVAEIAPDSVSGFGSVEVLVRRSG
ncbi:MAG: hypothetical protein ACT4QF_16930 [Sporichthyaceae bacterium]